MRNDRRRTLAALAAFGVLTLPAAAQAADFPSKPVRVIVPFAPGGATDVVARALGVRLSQRWGQPVVVENKPGAGGNIGADVVAKAAPDGYTLLLASPAEVTINPYLYPSMPFDPVRDLLPVAKVTTAPLVLVVHSNFPADSVQALVRAVKARPNGVNYASSGTGGPQHLAGELFRLMSGTQMTHVPYKGGAPAMNDLLGGQVDLFFAGLPPALPHVQSGRLRALAVTTAERSTLTPQVPTVAEQGYPGFDIENWQGVFAPAGTPPAIVAGVTRALAEICGDADFARQLQGQGASPAFLEGKAFSAFVDGERSKYGRLVKESGAKVD